MRAGCTHLQAGASPDAADSQGRTALHYAAENGKSHALETLTALGASLTAADHAGITPLHVAASSGHTAAVSTLLRLGADPKALSAKGLTPAQYVVNPAILPLLQPELAAADAASGSIPPSGVEHVVSAAPAHDDGGGGVAAMRANAGASHVSHTAAEATPSQRTSENSEATWADRIAPASEANDDDDTQSQLSDFSHAAGDIDTMFQVRYGSHDQPLDNAFHMASMIGQVRESHKLYFIACGEVSVDFEHVSRDLYRLCPLFRSSRFWARE
jgi:hypothetical protein